MALENRYKITVNTKKKISREIPEVVAYDKVVFEIEVYDDTVLFEHQTGYTYQFVSKKPKGNPVMREAAIVNGLVEVELGASEMDIPGKVEGTLQIYNTDMERISAVKFDYVVKKDPSLDGELPNDERNLVIVNESLLNDAITKSDSASTDSSTALTKATTAETKATSAETTANTVKDQFDQVIAEAGANNPEVVQARGTEVNLNARLTKNESALADIASLKAKNKYNLKGDGIADDTAGLQQYINDAVDLGFMYLPFGTYRFTSKLTIPDGIRIVGEKGKTNQKCTRLLYDGAVDSIAVEAVKLNAGTPTSFWGLAIEYISIVNKRFNDVTQDYGTDSTGIKLNLVSEGYFNNFQVTGFKVGILSAQANICDFHKCYVTNNQYGIWLGYNDLNGNSIGASEMNNFYGLNFWNNETHVVLGGESNFFIGCHMEQSKNVFLLNSKYAASCNNFEFRNGNIRNGNYGITDHTNSRLLNIVQDSSYPTAIYTKLKFANSNVRLYGSSVALNVGLLDATGAKAIDIALEDMDIFGITSLIGTPNFPFANLRLNGRASFKTAFDGSGVDSVISPDGLKLYGMTVGIQKNIIRGSVNLGVDQTGAPAEADFWYDPNFNVIRYYDGIDVRNLEQVTVGTTAQRPSSLYNGRQFFDTTINKLIIHKGAGVWVDAMGTTV